MELSFETKLWRFSSLFSRVPKKLSLRRVKRGNLFFPKRIFICTGTVVSSWRPKLSSPGSFERLCTHWVSFSLVFEHNSKRPGRFPPGSTLDCWIIRRNERQIVYNALFLHCSRHKSLPHSSLPLGQQRTPQSFIHWHIRSLNAGFNKIPRLCVFSYSPVSKKEFFSV